MRRARTAVVVCALLALLAAGLPAVSETAEAAPSNDTDHPLGLLDISDMSPEELIALTPDEELDTKRLAEESNQRPGDRPTVDPVAVREVPVKSIDEVIGRPEPKRSPRAGQPVEWPKPTQAEVVLSDQAAAHEVGKRGTRVSGQPVWLQAAAPADGVTSAAPGTAVSVRMLDRAAAGRHGGAIAVRLDAADHDGAGAVGVTVDYTGFEHAFGGDFGSRLHAVTLDATCVEEAICETTPVESVNDPVDGVVTASVPLSEGGTVMMLTADEDGPTGDWAATSLSPLGEWSHGGSSGDFRWSYPMRTPDMPGGLGPDLALNYSSGSTDGRTTSTNNQTSWVGEGFDLTPGFIERRYIACANDMADEANNTVKTGDLCWKKDNATMSLGGSSVVLVKDEDTGKWRPEHDDGSRVERLSGAGNGARNGAYWRVTTTDGVQYYFGKHKLSSADTAATNSVLTVPVAGNHAGEPCHAAAFADSFCDQAYRWLLDYVVDPNGNTMTYFYTRESNRYGQNLNKKSVSYHRGSYLRRVEYGQRKGSEQTTPAPSRVMFTHAERCLPSGTFDCSPGELTEDTADKWPDVPYDRICKSTTSCADRFSPTFFSRIRLTRVETQVRVSGSYESVDRWDLTHKFLDPGDGWSPALWLSSVRHTGMAGTDVELPTVRFGAVQLPNRVDTIGDSTPELSRHRIAWIETETGAVISVNYKPVECTPTNLPTAHTNAKRCFPVYFNLEGSQDPSVHWFHKHAVDSIIETDTTGDSVDVEHHYTYGTPGWAYNNDEFTKAKHRTWSQWRGYKRVTTKVGDPDSESEQLKSTRLYFRGLHGDRQSPTGGTKVKSVEDSWGDSRPDLRAYRGMLREEIVYNGSAKVTSTVHDPYRSAVTADDGRRTARIVDVAATREHTKLSTPGWRTTETTYEYDTHGLVTKTNDRGDVSTTADDLCTRTRYAKNTSKWILETVKRTETVSTRCSVSPSRPDDVVSDERFSYDGGSYGAAPSRGNVTSTQVLDDWSGGPAYVTTSRASYDAHGRVRSKWDALDRKTTTAYTPATGGPVINTVVTNPAGHTTTTELDPKLGVPTRVTDANGRHTDAVYDALGRLTRVWFTDRDKATQTPSVEYSYKVSKSAPVAVTTKSLLPYDPEVEDAKYASSVELYDSLLRPRETQEPEAGDNGGRVVNLTEYDSRGLAIEVKGPFYTTGGPSTTLLDPSEAVPRYAVSTFDGAGRVTLEQLLIGNEDNTYDEHSRRVTSYGGDRVSVKPPQGGTATTTISDARGRTVELREHHAPTPSGEYDATTYTHTPDGELASMTDAAGNTWSYIYDLRGRRVSVDDPDAGVSTTVYDDASQISETTDGRGETLTHSYDALGRKIATRDASDTLLAEWEYDTFEKGYPSSSTRYVGGNPYTVTTRGYDDGYRPWGETITIPESEDDLAGNYGTLRTYNPDGSVAWEIAPEITEADLPLDNLYTAYTATGYPHWMQGAGEGTYVADTLWSQYGEVHEYSLGVHSNQRNYQAFEYEKGTHRLSQMTVWREGLPHDTHVTYTHDPAGNPVRIADTGDLAGNGDAQCYTYDHHRRLTNAWSQASGGCGSDPGSSAIGGTAPYGQTYTYDDAGNREQLEDHVADTVTTYSYPSPGADNPHALTGMTTTDPSETQVSTFDYDGAGNTTTTSGATGEATYGWNAEGRMATADTTDGTSEYIYTADGDRLIRRDPDATTLYVFGTELRLDHTTGEVTGTRYYTFNDTILAMRQGEDVHTLGADLWGTPTITINNDTHTATARRFDPFGNPRGDIPNTWPGERGYHTATHDKTTGLEHMGARPYQALTGRFLSVDPLLDPTDSQQIHGYAYANNNPLTYTDPDGLEPRPWHNPNFDSSSFDYADYWAGEEQLHPGKAAAANSRASSQANPASWDPWGPAARDMRAIPVKVDPPKPPTHPAIDYGDPCKWAKYVNRTCATFQSDTNLLEVLYEFTPVADFHHCVDGSESCWWILSNVAGPIGKALKAPKIVGKATEYTANTTTRVAGDAVEHSYKYHPRIRQRALEDPRAHNFPYSFDDVILREKPITQADGSLLYRKVGTINGRDGTYEIGLSPDTGVIFHRTWRRP